MLAALYYYHIIDVCVVFIEIFSFGLVFFVKCKETENHICKKNSNNLVNKLLGEIEFNFLSGLQVYLSLSL